MADLNLTGQQAQTNQIAPKIQTLKDRMNERKAIWDKLPDDKKKLWITSGDDPIMTLAWQSYRFLRDNFFNEDVDSA